MTSSFRLWSTRSPWWGRCLHSRMCPTTTSFILCRSFNQLQCPWWSDPIRYRNDQSVSRMRRWSSPRCIRRWDWFIHSASRWYICFPCQCFATDLKYFLEDSKLKWCIGVSILGSSSRITWRIWFFVGISMYLKVWVLGRVFEDDFLSFRNASHRKFQLESSFKIYRNSDYKANSGPQESIAKKHFVSRRRSRIFELFSILFHIVRSV